MSLATGTRLGSHEIIGLLGAGGMGEVYLAQDTRLNRRVALKVLPEAYASDPDRIARFHREAQAVAALNHTSIAAIYDLAEADGTKFLVLELIEGDTLADRLKRGAIAVEEALLIARQILEALEAAHEKGVCHRDLKPANIKLTPDGVVKVLDFGLAKFLQSGPAPGNLSHSPTLSLATFPGVILGTAAYMSPEQAKGFEADQRSDIFSFGCVLFEMLTGRQAFDGDTASEILASVLKSDVDLAALPPKLNPRLIEVLRRCLEVTGGPVPLVEGVRRGGSGAAGGAPAAAQFSFSANGTLAYVPGPTTLGSITEADLALFDRKGEVQPLKLPPGPYRAPRVSPDGRWVVFESADEKGDFISVYELAGRSAARRLTFDGNNRAPVWSADGQWVAFQSDREGDLAIFRTRADGSGTAERLTKPEAGIAHIPQSLSRDGEHLLFSAQRSESVLLSTLWLMTMKDRKIAPFGDVQAREAVFSPDGKWIAYQTRSANSNVVFVEPFPRTGAKYLLPQDPAGHPFWSPKGDELIVNVSPTSNSVVTVTTTPRFGFGRPADFPRRGRSETSPTTTRRSVDMMPDGQRVIGVLSQLAPITQAPRITVVLNWFDEVRQRVPVSN